MKRSVLALSLLILLILPLISSASIEMNETFNQGETLIAQVYGNFIEPLSEENVLFYRGHVKIPVEFAVAKLQDYYYVYALLAGKDEGNYSLSIENSKYLLGNEVIETPLAKNFFITNQTADFSINPGFILTAENFEIELQNLQESKIKITSGERELELRSGEKKKMNFNISDFGSFQVNLLELSSNNTSYSVPVYIQTATQTSFLLTPLKLNISLPTNQDNTRIFILANTGDKTLTDISISVSDSLSGFVKIKTSELAELAAGEEIELELTMRSNKQEKVAGSISVASGELILSSSIYLDFIENYQPEAQQATIISKPCKEQGGHVCEDNEACDETLKQAKDTMCCFGKCTAKPSAGKGKTIGIIVLIILIAIIVFFALKKYKGAKKPVDLLKIARGKNNKE